MDVGSGTRRPFTSRRTSLLASTSSQSRSTAARSPSLEPAKSASKGAGTVLGICMRHPNRESRRVGGSADHAGEGVDAGGDGEVADSGSFGERDGGATAQPHTDEPVAPHQHVEIS